MAARVQRNRPTTATWCSVTERAQAAGEWSSQRKDAGAEASPTHPQHPVMAWELPPPGARELAAVDRGDLWLGVTGWRSPCPGQLDHLLMDASGHLRHLSRGRTVTMETGRDSPEDLGGFSVFFLYRMVTSNDSLEQERILQIFKLSWEEVPEEGKKVISKMMNNKGL